DGIRDFHVTGVQTCALPIFRPRTPMQGEVSPCEPLWPASQLILAEKIRLSQRIVRHVLCHDPCPESSGHGYRIFSPAGWPEWAGTTSAATTAWFYWVLLAFQSNR